MRIETEHLNIVEFTPDMARDVHANSLDDDTRRFVPDEVFATVDAARRAVEFLMAQYGRPDGPQAYPVLAKADGANVGYVQLVPLDGGRWEIGYHIARRYTGRGYATEAVRAFVPKMAQSLGIREVYGVCLCDNLGSRRVLEKCGFEPVFEGVGDYQGQKREIFVSVCRL